MVVSRWISSLSKSNISAAGKLQINLNLFINFDNVNEYTEPEQSAGDRMTEQGKFLFYLTDRRGVNLARLVFVFAH